MSKLTSAILFTFNLLLLLPLNALAGNIHQLSGEATLRTIDNFRSEPGSVKISSTVTSYRNGEITNTRQYDVYSTSDSRSLVIFKSASEQGQKVLMRGHDYWLFMPRSRRPIRITPMQKLLGDASLGDIATLSWSEDYEIHETINKGATWRLELHATSPKLSYERILLEVDTTDLFPLKAALYLRSGMHAKTAEFERGVRNEEVRVVAMALHDEMRPGHTTVISYDHIESIHVPDRLFNPQVLIRTDLDQLLTD
ncbi:outer membrane lipoprotein-sorting protein [Aliidiomarina minuta]|uniref:Outer membrane lipoprotein-sorting protein n=1 Tax=Aliidiomarina minuta TaxID=880057 RepID=A0A432WBB2_9GAMM|nr:outer membrane lipoprotein-sorting protein [Aliidiomarina minuta]RUO26878.1 outer membrane lipoprotein-sorting protein [Aliidiomarina minuta]